MKKIKVRLEGIEPKPEEVVIITYDEPATYDEVKNIYNAVKEAFPNQNVVIKPSYFDLKQRPAEELQGIVDRLNHLIEGQKGRK